MRYQVLDNGMPADTSRNGAGAQMAKGLGWDNSIFDTKMEAYHYCYSWLGAKYQPDNQHYVNAYLKNLFAKPWKYNNSGDTIQVKEIE